MGKFTLITIITLFSLSLFSAYEEITSEKEFKEYLAEAQFPGITTELGNKAMRKALEFEFFYVTQTDRPIKSPLEAIGHVLSKSNIFAPDKNIQKTEERVADIKQNRDDLSIERIKTLARMYLLMLADKRSAFAKDFKISMSIIAKRGIDIVYIYVRDFLEKKLYFTSRDMNSTKKELNEVIKKYKKDGRKMREKIDELVNVIIEANKKYVHLSVNDMEKFNSFFETYGNKFKTCKEQLDELVYKIQ